MQMKLTADDAKELARWFRELSVTLGNYRFSNWSKLSEEERAVIESKEWTLLNYSSDFITQAVWIILDDAQGSFEKLRQATAEAKKAISNIQTIKQVISIATSVIELAAAVMTKNPATIVTAIEHVINAVNEAL